MNGRHGISTAEFTALAHGHGGVVTVQNLRTSQVSKRLLLMSHIAEVLSGAGHKSSEALAVLDAARSRNPEAARETLIDPMVGAWVSDTLRHWHAATSPTAPGKADLGYLVGLAAVAASRAGVDAELVMERHQRIAMLPTMGLVDLGRDDDQPLRIVVRAGRISIADLGPVIRVPSEPDARGAHWQGLWRLTSDDVEAPAAVTLDDISPHRNIYHVHAADRLQGGEVGDWRRLFAAAWRLLVNHANDRAMEITSGLRTMVPLRANEAGIGRSGTARHVFGAFGATRPASAAELAITMVHELQHSKLNAVLDLVPLFEANDDVRYFAPWRTDPRPIDGLFHGVYAFLAVADVLQRLRADPDLCASAEKQFAVVREQLRSGLETLLGASSLTPPGRRFAVGMQECLARLDTVDVGQGAADIGRRALESNRMMWQERSGRTARA